jgi:N-acetylmuramoyl-L-alanine amidase CwlA
MKKQYWVVALLSVVASSVLWTVDISANAINNHLIRNGLPHARITSDIWQTSTMPNDGNPHAKIGNNYQRFPTYNYNYADKPNMPNRVVVHETANESSTTSSEIAYMKNNYGNAFVHTFIDDTQIRNIANTDYIAWGSGAKGNLTSIQFEQTRVHSKNAFVKQIGNSAYYTAYVLAQYGLTPTPAKSNNTGTVWSHHQVSRWLGGTDHTDPDGYWADRAKRFWGTTYTMTDFLALVKQYHAKIVKTTRFNMQTPTMNPVAANSKTVTGTAMPYSTVTLARLTADSKVMSSRSVRTDGYGNYRVNTDNALPANARLQVVASAPAYSSKSVRRSVAVNAQATPTFTQLVAGNRTIKGTATPNSRVTIYKLSADSKVLGTKQAYTNANGNFTLTLQHAFTNGQRVQLKAELGGYAAKNIRQSVGIATQVVPTFTQLVSGNKVVKGTATPNSRVTINKLSADSKVLGAKRVYTDARGNFSFTLVHAPVKNDRMRLTAELGGYATTTKHQSVDVATLITPSFTQLAAGNREIKGKSIPNSRVTLSRINPDGTVHSFKRAYVNSNGNFSISIVHPFESGQRVRLTAELAGYAAKTLDRAVAVSALQTPTSNVLMAGNTQISGTATPNSEIIIVNRAGDELGRGITNTQGQFRVVLSSGLVTGDRIRITSTMLGYANKSINRTVTNEGSLKVTIVRHGDMEVRGTTLPNSTVTVAKLNAAGNVLGTAKTTADSNGRYTIAVRQAFVKDSPIRVTSTLRGYDDQIQLMNVAPGNMVTPTINPVHVGDKVVTGTAQPDSQVTFVRLMNGQSAGTTSTKADAKGQYRIVLQVAFTADMQTQITTSLDGYNSKTVVANTTR